MAILKELEGTWEELSARAEEFKGHRLKLVILPDAVNASDDEGPVEQRERVQRLLREWQAQDNTPKLPPIPMLPGETPTQALFRQWEEEDSQMTEEEMEAEERLWEDFQQGINETRTELGMRRLF